MDSPVNYQKANRFRRGWALTKSSWRVLVLDKELATLPVIGFITAIISTILIIVLGVALLASTAAIKGATGHGGSLTVQGSATAVPFIVLGVILYIMFTLIGNYFSGAIVYGATERFRGGDPTVRSSLKGAARKLGPLTKFSVLSGTIGLILQVLRDRLPFVGDMIVNLGGLAWSIATIFAVPVIVLSEDNVSPVEAVKQSTSTVRKIWGEGMIAQAGIAIITTLSILGYIAINMLIGSVISSLHLPIAVVGSLFGLGILGLIALSIVFGTLSAIARAAMYHYATTNEAPETFDKDLLQASMTVNKARRIFA